MNGNHIIVTTNSVRPDPEPTATHNHITVTISFIRPEPQQKHTPHTVLKYPFWCIIVLKNPDAQFIAPPFCTDKICVIIIISLETFLMVDVMQSPLGLANTIV